MAVNAVTWKSTGGRRMFQPSPTVPKSPNFTPAPDRFRFTPGIMTPANDNRSIQERAFRKLAGRLLGRMHPAGKLLDLGLSVWQIKDWNWAKFDYGADSRYFDFGNLEKTHQCNVTDLYDGVFPNRMWGRFWSSTDWNASNIHEPTDLTHGRTYGNRSDTSNFQLNGWRYMGPDVSPEHSETPQTPPMPGSWDYLDVMAETVTPPIAHAWPNLDLSNWQQYTRPVVEVLVPGVIIVPGTKVLPMPETKPGTKPNYVKVRPSPAPAPGGNLNAGKNWGKKGREKRRNTKEYGKQGAPGKFGTALLAVINFLWEAVERLEIVAEAAGYWDHRPGWERAKHNGPNAYGDMFRYLFMEGGIKRLDLGRLTVLAIQNEVEDRLIGWANKPLKRLYRDQRWSRIIGVQAGPAL